MLQTHTTTVGSGGRLRFYGKSKILNISKITASINTKQYTIVKPIKIATRNAKETFEFLRISWILQAFLEK